MRRFHRRLHLWMWIALAPLTAVGLALAIASVPKEQTNDLDGALISEAP